MLPPRLCRVIIFELARMQNWALGWGFDGRKNIYSPTAFLSAAETKFEVPVPEEDEPAKPPAGKEGKPARGPRVFLVRKQ